MSNGDDVRQGTLGLLGKVKALEYAVQVLCITHPSPRTAHEAWQRVLVEVTDAHSGLPSHGSEAYRAGLSETLASVSKQLDTALRG